MILYDDLVVLRAIEDEDAEVLKEMINSPEIENAVVGYSFPVSSVQQKKWIQDLSSEHIIRYAVDNRSGIVGMASISSIDLKNRTANLNIKIRLREQGRGYAVHAVKLMIRYCFEELGMECLTAQVLENNQKSRRLFEKNGFHIDGILRSRVYKNGTYQNLVAYSILRAEYENGNRQ